METHLSDINMYICITHHVNVIILVNNPYLFISVWIIDYRIIQKKTTIHKLKVFNQETASVDRDDKSSMLPSNDKSGYVVYGL